jgi:hypothetical protein
MATEQADAEAVEADGVSDHVRAVTVTAIASLAGIAAAFVSEQLTAGMAPEAAARASQPLLVVFALIALQPALLRLVGLLKDDFGAKDLAYIAFLTFSMWFISWGILLTSGG